MTKKKLSAQRNKKEFPCDNHCKSDNYTDEFVGCLNPTLINRYFKLIE